MEIRSSPLIRTSPREYPRAVWAALHVGRGSVEATTSHALEWEGPCLGASGSHTSSHAIPHDTDAVDLWDAAEETESLAGVELACRMTP